MAQTVGLRVLAYPLEAPLSPPLHALCQYTVEKGEGLTYRREDAAGGGA